MTSLGEFSIAIAALLLLILLRTPVGLAMLSIGVIGFGLEAGVMPSLAMLQQAIFHAAGSEIFTIVPLFILMGSLAFVSGTSDELFNASNAWFGHLRGGLALSSMVACGGFAAICGSSLASAATMGKVALPVMQGRGYPADFAGAVIAAGGTLGVLIPPSIVLVLYGVLIEADIAALFAAALIPGALALLFYMATIVIISSFNPELAPTATKVSRAKAFRELKKVWTTVALFLLVIGGIYLGWFTPSEASAVGVCGLLALGALKRQLNASKVFKALSDTVATTGRIFLVVIGAIVLSRYLAVNQLTQELSIYVANLNMTPFIILMLILAFYLLMGAFMDTLAVIVLTVPIIHPIIVGLGFNEIWFGIILVMVVELGLITPPYGMNVFVLRSVSKDLPMGGIFRRLLPFIFSDLLRLALFAAIPALVLWVPSLI